MEDFLSYTVLGRCGLIYRPRGDLSADIQYVKYRPVCPFISFLLMGCWLQLKPVNPLDPTRHKTKTRFPHPFVCEKSPNSYPLPIMIPAKEQPLKKTLISALNPSSCQFCQFPRPVSMSSTLRHLTRVTKASFLLLRSLQSKDFKRRRPSFDLSPLSGSSSVIDQPRLIS